MGNGVTMIGRSSIANSVAIQVDGKIVVAGYSPSYNHLTLTLLSFINANGSFDPTFGGGTVIYLITNAYRAMVNCHSAGRKDLGRGSRF